MTFRSIKSKLALALSVYGILIISILAYTVTTANNRAIDAAKKTVLNKAKDLAEQVRTQIELALSTTRTISQAFATVKDPESLLDIGRIPARAMLKSVLDANESIQSIYMVWEPDAFDLMDEAFTNTQGHDESGRFIPRWTRTSNGQMIPGLCTEYKNDSQLGKYYQLIRNIPKQMITDPYSVQGRAEVISVLSPIQYGDRFLGIVGADIALTQIRAIIDNFKMKNPSVQVSIYTYSAVDLTKSQIQRRYMKSQFLPPLIQRIHQRKELVEMVGDNIVVYTPLRMNETDTPWMIQITEPTTIGWQETNQIKWLFVFIACIGLIALLIIWFINRLIRPLIPLAKMAEQVAMGEMEIVPIHTDDDEIGKVNTSFIKLAQFLKEITLVCQSTAYGDFSHKITPRSQQDLLSQSVNQMVENLQKVVVQAKRITSGDYSVLIQPFSEKDELGIALYEMTDSLRRLFRENERKDLLKTIQMELNDQMRVEQELTPLVRKIICYICQQTQSAIGAFYVVRDEALYLEGSYAWECRKGMSSRFRFGQGLVGQAALEKQRIIVSEPPEDYIRIQSGLGRAVPNFIIIQPVLVNDMVVAVMELGTFKAPDHLQLAILDQVTPAIGIALNSVQSRARLAELLQETQKQAQLLQQQQEELKQANDELASQAEALKISEARLQAQKEEMRQANRKLEERTRALEASEQRMQAHQEELRQANEELEEQTRLLEEQKADIELKNSQLESARAMIEEKARDLERANQYKSEFLANMSHELRTPLNSILILSRMLAENRHNHLTEKEMEYGQTIYNSAKDLLELINDILDLSKVEAGKLEMDWQDVVLEDIASGLDSRFRPMAEQKGLNFSITISDDLPSVIHTDQRRVEQILKNFLSNAFKFTQQGYVKLMIQRPSPPVEPTRLELKGRKVVAFSVEDTGIGIAKDKRDKIFEAFRQADGSMSRKYGGTGLGLSISQELASVLGGEIHMTSQVNQGSVFTLLLPETTDDAKADVDNTALQQCKKKTKSPETTEPLDRKLCDDRMNDDRGTIQPGDRSILIIEDDFEFARILKDLSREKGFRVLMAGDGETGLALANTYRPTAIILDIGLPGIDGWAVMNRLKENPSTRHIPVHFISGEDKKQDAMKMGAAGFVTKPVTMDRIEQVYDNIQKQLSAPFRKLLIVVDDPEQTNAIKILLADKDLRITTASSGKQALECMSQADYDCIILDLGLPDMSGVDLVQQIKNTPELAHIPVIIYSGQELSKEQEAVLSQYAEKVITKGDRSSAKLLDETALFLHRVESDLSEDKQRLIRLVHDKESILMNRKILLVDDDMRNVYALTSMLEDKGMEVIPAKNGKDAIAQLMKHPDVDLVIMDIMMPEMDGYQACREIRKMGQFAELPIIALTAKAMKGDRIKCIEAGANDYLAKPVDKDKLLSILRVWLY